MALPIHKPVLRPACLAGMTNGKLPDKILVSIPGQMGGPVIRLVEPAARAWKAMQSDALAAGHVLKATSTMDSFRPYAVQERIFRQRYTTTYLAGRPYRVWNGRRWYQRPNTAAAAIPGTSNHGWAMAVDAGEESDGEAGNERLDADTLRWLVRNEERCGWSHELESEPWHLRYWAGDRIPAAVLAYEAGSAPAPAPTPAPPVNDDEEILLWA